MKKAQATYITIGKIGASYGVHGWLKIHTYSEYGATIVDYIPWYIENDARQWELLDLEETKPHGKHIIAKIKGINSPEKARFLTGKSLAVPRSQLPPLKKNEYYWSDLKGLTVINKDGETLGKVIYLMETGSNDVLVVKGTKEIAIPYLYGTVVKAIDLEKGEIQVDWELL